MSSETIQISNATMENSFFSILERCGFSRDKAKTLAHVFTENSLEGVYTHGVNRFSKFVQYVKEGHIKINAEPSCTHRMGGMEQWNGHSGPGPLNAMHCTDRAMELARDHGIGCVAIAFTNHWMRGGTYGWRAAKNGFIFIGWTNTIANLPAWGAKNSKLGNNPMVLAVPYEKEAIVLDTAMSQYSFGSLELYKMRGEKLPVPGGYNTVGEVSNDPSSILESGRALPIGYWKGAGLSLLLDVVAVILSGGLSVKQITDQGGEHNLSQVFVAIDISKLENFRSIESAVRQIIDDYHQSQPVMPGKKVLYPGERVLKTREENLRNGIPVLKDVWDAVQKL
jgi:3-dehydro-L-gulonate 2-dehydrogenase